MANLKYGSKGDEVKQLQQALISAGYDVGGSGADGSYGPATQAAVTQYQKDHGLSVDGLAGPETQGALYSSGGTTTGSSGGTRNYAGTTYQSSDYHKDATTAAAAGDWDKVKEALNNREIVTGSLGTNYGKTSMDIYNELLDQYGGPQNEMEKLYALIGNLQTQLLQPVQPYTPSWGDQKYEELLQQAIAMNYDDWTQGDQYKSLVSRYGNQGKMSMQDVLGQISSRTGGLASSYATTAAQQQYNEYMSQLEEVARQMFAGERSDLIENAGLARDYGEQEYGRYLDQLNMQNDRNSYALDVINQMMGYQQDKANTQYTQGQNAKTEAQDRINSYLAAYGSVADLDPNLVRDSGYTQSELATIERYYADQKEKEAATGGGGGNGGGPGGDERSSNYDQVRKNAIAYDDMDDAVAYIDRMVDMGYITEQEAADIYLVELGGSYEPVAKVPTTWDEYYEATGTYPSLTQSEFSRLGSGAKYGSYAEQLAAEYSRWQAKKK